jgi:hypothetical protein
MNRRMTKVEANVNTDTMCDAVFVHESETLLGKNELGLIETWYDCARTNNLSGHLESNVQAVERRDVPMKAPVCLHNERPFTSRDDFHVWYSRVARICSKSQWICRQILYDPSMWLSVLF